MMNVKKMLEKQAVYAMYKTLKLVPLSLFNTGELLAWDGCKQAYNLTDTDMMRIMDKVRKKIGHPQIWGSIPDDFDELKAKAKMDNKGELDAAQRELRKRR